MRDWRAGKGVERLNVVWVVTGNSAESVGRNLRIREEQVKTMADVQPIAPKNGYTR